MLKFFASVFIIVAAATGFSLAKFGAMHTIETNAEAFSQLMSELPYVSPGYSPDQTLSYENAMYEISFRTCPACIAYHKGEFPKLQKMGVDTRLFVFARSRKYTPPEERAVIAELYKTRSWDLAQNWFEPKNPGSFYKTMRDIPPADGNRKRSARVKSGQEQFRRLARILNENDIKAATPILIWQSKDGSWKTVVGNSPLTNMLIRRAFK